ncbi:hypothetical protein MNBD_GAMMA18-913 [hydrothermal vent metagenome]|uniref:Histidine kinase/HSP90-like ATPase domain-containing protein n=1 Tax=hydrothermal vent metagenome TaxID=652676 RepID=A0A3B0Z892_9ZZZZ
MNHKENAPRFPLGTTLLVLLIVISMTIGAISYYRYATAPPPADAIKIEQVRFHPAETAHPPPKDDPGWIMVSLPHDWRNAQLAGLEGWYLFDFSLSVPPSHLWGIYLPRVTSNVLAYLNNKAIGQGGRFSDPVARNWSRPLYFTIPNGILRDDTNRLTLRVKTSLGSPGYLGPVYLGPDALLRPVFERNYGYRIGIVENMIVGILLVAMLILGLWVTRRKDTLHLWFAAMNIIWAAHVLNLLVVEIPVSLRVWESLRYLTVGWFVVLLVTTMHRFIGVRSSAIEYSIYGVALVGSVVMCLLPDDEDFFRFANEIWISAVLLLGVYPAVRVTIAWWRSWNLEYLIGICTGLPILLAASHDWLRINGYIARDQGHLMQYSAPVLLLGFTVVLLGRYVRAQNESEVLINTMEAQIENKRQQLESTYQQMQKMEHDHLLSNERERIMRDMHDGVGGHLVSALAMTECEPLKTDKLKEMLSSALVDLRLMIDSLDQTEGDLVSVLGTLRARLQPLLEESGIAVRWQVDDLPAVADLGPGRVLQIMRILQEAITNVLKHSQAQTLTFTTGAGENAVFIDIRDDGIGIQESQSNGHGLRNMRYRAKRADVDLKIERAEPGTRVRITVQQNSLTDRCVSQK